MSEQINHNTATFPNRLTVIIEGRELKKWKSYFLHYGTKTLFEKSTGVSRQTLHNILKEGRGDYRTVDAVREFLLKHGNKAA